ncbi:MULTISPECIES: alpha/beta hydrolase [unclassified Micromonospora]|uniref:alpha/beta hydrolase n=1 Tax=unclassified Micromonospora TaxID=2617518 RepID=UPI001C2177C5|nr:MULTISPECIES: alpha/beta hydrolase [unclassified Micromonospora]MBU8856674.1 alpha/beta hydrolase [Micromonospora sp. WMMB482]MDM4782289.1 alpha/beta hydrolase [Micromonospora sp. b486]
MTERAVLLWIHGGGWRARAEEDGAALASLGLRVVGAAYRFSHQARWPAQLDDVRAAARAARAGARGLPLLVGGDSAGGMLALHLGLRGVDRPGDVAGVLAYWAPVDPLDPEQRRRRAPGDDPWTDLLGHPPAAGDPATVDATVATHSGSGVPVLLVQGRDDEAVPAAQPVELTGRLLAAGHPAHLWLTHGGHALDLARPDLRATAAAFLDNVLPTAAGD